MKENMKGAVDKSGVYQKGVLDELSKTIKEKPMNYNPKDNNQGRINWLFI